MTKDKRKRMVKYKQKYLNQTYACLFIMNLIVVIMILLAVLIRASGNNEIEGGKDKVVYEQRFAKSISHDTAILPANALIE